MEPRLAHALRTLQKLLQDASTALKSRIRFALIGGLALSAWGVVRATEDMDLLADSEPTPLRNLAFRDAMRKFLEARGCRAEWRAGDTDDPIPLLLRLTPPKSAHGPGADIIWAHKRWQREALSRTISLKVSRMEVCVVHPEDLVLLKLDAGGPQDLLDVEMLLSNPPPELNLKRLKKKAIQLRLATELGKCLRHSRK